jgi:cytochrome c
MKVALISAIVMAGVLSVGVARAAEMSEAAKTAGCVKCHEIDKKKKGPAFQESAKKYKSNADAEGAMFKSITDTKGDHPEIKATPDQIKAVLKWVKTL